MRSKYFDIKRDRAVIETNGFFCQACLVGKPAGEQSPDKQYCQGCYDFLQDGEKAVEPSKDYWTPDGTLFVHYGKKYGVTKTGATVCLGGAETPPDGSRTAPASREVVSKIPDRGILPVEPIQAQDRGIMKQRGRPRKQDGEVVSRVTKWRRKQELKKQGLQGVLV